MVDLIARCGTSGTGVTHCQQTVPPFVHIEGQTGIQIQIPNQETRRSATTTFRFHRSTIFTSSNLVARSFVTDSTFIRVKIYAQIIIALLIPLAITRMASLVKRSLFIVVLCVVVVELG